MTTLLHGLDRSSYQTRFSLNDEVLRSGGEEIATAKGDLGRLLHAGTSGLSGLSRSLEAVQSDVAGFYKKGGSAQTVPEAKRRLRELDAELRERRLAPSRHDDLRRKVEERRVIEEEARATLAGARRDLAHAEGAERRKSLRADRQRLLAELERFPDGPDLPRGAVAEVVDLAGRMRDARRRESDAEIALGAALERIEALVPDPQGLELGPILDMMDDLTLDDGPLLLRVGGANADLEDRRREREPLAREVTSLAARIAGRDVDPAEVTLDEEFIDRIDAALRDLSEAEIELQKSKQALAEERREQGSEPPVVVGEEALAEALHAMETKVPALDALREEAAEAETVARQSAEGLTSGWRNQLETSGGLPAESDLSDLILSAERTAKHLEDATERLEKARAERETAEARLWAAERDPSAIDVAQLQLRRSDRDAAWSDHRAKLDHETADRFEAAMRADDIATAAHAAGSEARARLLTRQEEAETARSTETAAARLRTEAAERCGKSSTALSAMAGRLLLPEDAAAAAMGERRRKIVAALEARKSAEASRERLQRAENRHAELAEALDRALEASGGARQGLSVVAAARRHQDALRQMTAARTTWLEREHRIGRLSGRVEQAMDRARIRRRAFDVSGADNWAGGREPDEVRAALPKLRQLAARMRDLRKLDHRIGRMEEALKAFERAAERPRQILGSDRGSEELLREARSRLSQAQWTARELASEVERKAKAEEAIETSRRELETAEKRVAQILAGQPEHGGRDLSEFVQRLEDRDKLRAKLAELDLEIVRAGEGLDADRLTEEEELDDPARVPGLRDAVEAAKIARDEASRQLGAAQQQLQSALNEEGAAAADQERAAILEDLRGGAQDTVARAIGLAAARAALRRLAEARRGPMLRDTEAAFRTLTGGVWSRLDTWVEGQSERLAGIRGDRPVPADGMSTGTRAQLYLALRIAGHAAFVREAGPLPFVTDDILESFDDDRAAAALDLTAELGRRGQAILFTHHAHLVEMARDRIDGVNVLELSPHAASAPRELSRTVD